jgi:hypothetical protein
LNRKKIYSFLDKYVTRMHGSRHITSWAAMNKNKTIFDLFTIYFRYGLNGSGDQKWA